MEKFGRLWAWFHATRHPPQESIAARFIRLFESHGVHRNQIPRFFGHDLSIKDIQDDTALLAKLNEPLLDTACAKFAVRREWLDGADDQVYKVHQFYKFPEEFAKFIVNLKTENLDGHLDGVLFSPVDQHRDADSLLLLEEIIGYVGDKAINRYRLCIQPAYSYWKARAYLTACVAIAWKHKIFVKGIRSPSKDIKQIASGKLLPFWSTDGIWTVGGVKWYPEDMALHPDAYLDGLDPEHNNFGVKAGLGLWLELDSQGLMDTGLNKSARELFQQELNKYL